MEHRRLLCIVIFLATFAYSVVSVARCRSYAEEVRASLEELREIRQQIRATLIEAGLIHDER